MATNVDLATANFCASPRSSDEFCNIYESAGQDYFKIVNSNGDTVGAINYTTDTVVGTIESIEYVGARRVGTVLGNDLPFFTLEHDSSTQCTIREWRLNTTGASLDLYNTIVKSGPGFDCYDMAVEYYGTTFSQPTATGTGFIEVTTYSNVVIGDKLLLGPSGDTDNLNAYEWVTVTGIDDTGVYLPPKEPYNEYLNNDDIAYYKNIFLFSDVAQNSDSIKGSFYKLDPYNGNVLEVQESGIYSGVRASAWSPTYQAAAFVKGNNILYTTTSGTYQITKSQVLNNIESDKKTIIPVYDLVFDDIAIYKLQLKRTTVDDDGAWATENWGTYNHQIDTVAPYTKSVDISAPSQFTSNDTDSHGKSIALTAVVRDQFGVGLSAILVDFENSGDAGNFTPVGHTDMTDANGIAVMEYDTAYYDPEGGGTDVNNLIIAAKAIGGSVGSSGSQYVWDALEFDLHKKFTIDLLEGVEQKPTLSGVWPTEGSELYTEIGIEQIEEFTTTTVIRELDKFQFPGGHWEGGVPPAGFTELSVLRQIQDFSSETYIDQTDKPSAVDMPGISIPEFSVETVLEQSKEQSNDLQVSQVYVSRHVSTGHQDDVDIDQFRFIEDAIPAFWSSKNPVNTNIWIRLRPFAFSLNQSTLVFNVKEVSYAGDTGFIDVASQCTVTTFDAGGGLNGLDILYDPTNDFHHNAVVYVSIIVYDVAPLPNIIVTDYWFNIIPDYKAPYIENEVPGREEEDVLASTNISFDIFDTGVGVDMSTFEFYVNNRIAIPVTSTISGGGYHVEYNPPEDFYYGQTVEVSVKVDDISAYSNTLYDMWRFYIVGSTGPWIDPSSYYPKNCARGVVRDQSVVSFNVYEIDGTGLDTSSIEVHIGGKRRKVTITPIVYRVY